MYLSNIWLIGNTNLWNYIHIDPKYLLLPSVEKKSFEPIGRDKN